MLPAQGAGMWENWPCNSSSDLITSRRQWVRVGRRGSTELAGQSRTSRERALLRPRERRRLSSNKEHAIGDGASVFLHWFVFPPLVSIQRVPFPLFYRGCWV